MTSVANHAGSIRTDLVLLLSFSSLLFWSSPMDWSEPFHLQGCHLVSSSPRRSVFHFRSLLWFFALARDPLALLFVFQVLPFSSSPIPAVVALQHMSFSWNIAAQLLDSWLAHGYLWFWLSELGMAIPLAVVEVVSVDLAFPYFHFSFGAPKSISGVDSWEALPSAPASWVMPLKLENLYQRKHTASSSSNHVQMDCNLTILSFPIFLIEFFHFSHAFS
jgi:hypothetical protein